MFPFRVQHIGVYTKEESLKRAQSYNGLQFSVSGVPSRSVYGMDLSGLTPYFLLVVKGEADEVEFEEGRENWTISLSGVEFALSSKTGCAVIRDGEYSVQIPLVTKIDETSVAGWRIELQRMRDALKKPTAENRIRAELGVMNIFRHLIDSNADELRETPAQELKSLIDADTTFEIPLSQLSERSEYSINHLRVLFVEEYGMTPNTYRTQCRLARAVELIANTQLSVKEISARLGFERVQAFSNTFHRLTNESPSTAIKRFRF